MLGTRIEPWPMPSGSSQLFFPFPNSNDTKTFLVTSSLTDVALSPTSSSLPFHFPTLLIPDLESPSPCSSLSSLASSTYSSNPFSSDGSTTAEFIASPDMTARSGQVCTGRRGIFVTSTTTVTTTSSAVSDVNEPAMAQHIEDKDAGRCAAAPPAPAAAIAERKKHERGMSTDLSCSDEGDGGKGEGEAERDGRGSPKKKVKLRLPLSLV